VRQGSAFTGYHSPDGVTWTQIGSPTTLTMAASVYVGLAVTSESDSQTTTATFDNVAVTSAGGTAVPDFTISSSGSTQSVDAGSTVNFALNTTAVGGFNSLISFSAAGLPNGATPTFNPTQVVGSGVITLTVATDATTPGGTFPVTVTGVSGNLTHSTALSLTVNPSTAPAGQITAITPTSGRAGSTTVVTITGQNTTFVQGTTQASFENGTSVDGGSSGGFGPVTVTSPTTAIASVQVATNASPGAQTVKVTTGSVQASLANGFTITQGLPVITFTTPQNLTFTSITPTTVRGTVSDPTAQVTVNGISAPFTPGAFVAAVPLVEGTNTLTAVARGSSGLVGTASVQVTLDTTPPRVTISTPVDGLSTTASTITVSGTINDLVVGTVNDQQATVTVNGTAAQVANRSFLAPNIPLTICHSPNEMRSR
jgi:hypothetical protein